MTQNYYADSLHAQKLFQVYQTEIPRVAQYLEAEIAFVRNSLEGNEDVLELAAGYGRIMKELADSCRSIVGIDIAENNVLLGREYMKDVHNARLLTMDAHKLDFKEPFDVILCLQNGLSAMKAEPFSFIKKTLAFLAPRGRAYFSSYSAKFWGHRLAWFQEQSAKGLLGEIDMEKTIQGVIVCKDGFTATTHSPEEMKQFGEKSGCAYQITEVDNSSIFLIITKN